jgi:hypothetical protein
VTNTAPSNSAVPTVSGTATVGNALSTTNGTWSDSDGDSRTYSYQWYRASDSSGTGETAISGATMRSILLKGSYLCYYEALYCWLCFKLEDRYFYLISCQLGTTY